MGAWGVKVLQNDYACDDLSIFLKSDPTRRFVYSLFSGDEYQVLLGVAIVDASINGVDESLLGGWGDYPKESKQFFKGLKSDPLKDMVSEAVSNLKRLINYGAEGWRDPEKRMEIYYAYLNRLTGA